MARVTLVTGQAQQGKTTLALAILQRECQRGLILDPVRSKPFTHCPSASSWDQLATWLASRAAEGRWVVALKSQQFEDYTQALAAAPAYRHVTILVDEGLMFATDPQAVEPMIRICRMNAHYGGGLGVPVLITAQRPNDLPPDVRSQADRWFSFRQEEPRDLQYLAERCTPGFADQVAGLGPHQFVSFPPTGPAGNGERSHGQGLEGRGLRGRRGGRAGPVTHDPATERGAEAARPDGRRLERVSEGTEP